MSLLYEATNLGNPYEASNADKLYFSHKAIPA